ncbi:ribosome-associated translation inhibitor RaiA [Crossiella equi]|uniref:Ribosome-associated translation inhibitor RaiA n=1 Tax=Crossiella equi TaxID=130796 RepID=A0ABS5A5F0_9PSEU|nr:HPF/RaiA family ribosome-associated protein [Crossiella equi]MBP2471823.1 ribosome-associated translation inhibitor RaiA [Crossiella equi]
MHPTHHISQLRIELDADVPGAAEEYARQKVSAVARFAPADIPYARVRIAEDAHRLVAHASLDVNGTPVNATASALTYQEAVDLLQDRLHHQLVDM